MSNEFIGFSGGSDLVPTRESYAGREERLQRVKFEAWMREVNRICAERLGVYADDLVDWTWRDAFDDGMTAEEALDLFMEEGNIE